MTGPFFFSSLFRTVLFRHAWSHELTSIIQIEIAPNAGPALALVLPGAGTTFVATPQAI